MKIKSQKKKSPAEKKIRKDGQLKKANLKIQSVLNLPFTGNLMIKSKAVNRQKD